MLDSPRAGRLLPVSLQAPCGCVSALRERVSLPGRRLVFCTCLLSLPAGALSPHPPGVALTGQAHEV